MIHTNDYMRFRISARVLAVVVPVLLVIFYVVYSIFQPGNLELSGNGLFIFYTREEFAPTLISEDNQSLYYSHEKNVTLFDDSLVFASGENSLKIVLSKSSVGTSVALMDFVPLADWSSKDSLSFFWFGAKSYSVFNLIIESKGGYCRKQIVDDWVGWKRLLVSFEDMEKLDNPDLKQVKRLVFQLASGDSLDVVWRLDRVILETIGDNSVFYNVTFGGQIYIKNHGNQLNMVTMEESFLNHAGTEVFASSEPALSIPSGKSFINFNFTVNLSDQDAPPQMTRYMFIVRLIAKSGIEIEEIRFDVPAFPEVLRKEST